MSKVIVIGSQKGGVGKTTTTLNLAYSLCSMGKKVLAIDFDSQANLSTCYGIENTKANTLNQAVRSIKEHDAEKELQKMQGLENARKEMGISDMDDKPLKQNMFKVV